MGRPLQKKFFGNTDGTGKQLVLSYVWLAGSTAAETGYYVVRQVGTGRYQVSNGTKTGVVKLTDVMPTAPGEGVILVRPFGTDMQDEYASKIHNRTVKTFDGNSYKWSGAAATEEGQADLQLEFWGEEGLEPEETPSEEPEVIFTITAAEAEGVVGFTTDLGSIDGQPEGFTVRELAVDGNVSRLVIAGDHPEIASIELVIEGVPYSFDYDGSEGATLFTSAEVMDFAAGGIYEVTAFITVAAPE